MNILKLAFGIITNPSATFEHIVKERLIFAAIKVWCFCFLFGLFARGLIISISIQEISLFNGVLLVIQPKIIFPIIAVLLMPYLENFLAVKFYDLKGNYLVLLSCNLFANIIGLLHTCLVILLAVFSALHLTPYLMIIFVPWGLVLSVRAIKATYDTSKETARRILLYSILIMSVVYIVLKCFVFPTGVISSIF